MICQATFIPGVEERYCHCSSVVAVVKLIIPFCRALFPLIDGGGAVFTPGLVVVTHCSSGIVPDVLFAVVAGGRVLIVLILCSPDLLTGDVW
jgi:hypothetical protein